MNEQKQIQVSLLRAAVRNFGEFFYRTSDGINSFVQPILPRDVLQSRAHMIMKLLTTSTTDGDANDITYGFALRFNCAEQAGGLEEVLNLLRFAISDAKVLEHLNHSEVKPDLNTKVRIRENFRRILITLSIFLFRA